MVDLPKFAVLMAAYNGMEWIEEQVRSILDQKYVSVSLYISVDESTDGTYAWCSEISRLDSRVVVLCPAGRFGGAAKNFFRLIRDVDFSVYDYVAFADQDDIWIDSKLISSHEAILDKNVYAYSANVTAFWPDGRQQLVDKAQKQRSYDFLFEAAGPGCSYTIKVSSMLKFKQVLVENRFNLDEVGLHDWLVYAWHRANGMSWYIDSVPRVLYRQHGGNQVGANFGLKSMLARIRLFRSGWYRTEVSKIASVIIQDLPDVPKSVAYNGSLPRSFVIANFGKFRRRFRDRVVLVAFMFLGIY
ncbi:glycosyltransferase [Stutzerimonas xanthomarina]|uniref:glycosyltransferase n=1 Tax=Stutzerimonas xanthomarina TaxID=271420 RepID=UPI00190E2133|nr:glycosyltransferase [Stutzerimonas xanthomarina]MBK3847258.1 glycosyltransferase [Stutzerimonas xanthomarina]